GSAATSLQASATAATSTTVPYRSNTMAPTRRAATRLTRRIPSPLWGEGRVRGQLSRRLGSDQPSPRPSPCPGRGRSRGLDLERLCHAPPLAAGRSQSPARPPHSTLVLPPSPCPLPRLGRGSAAAGAAEAQ